MSNCSCLGSLASDSHRGPALGQCSFKGGSSVALGDLPRGTPLSTCSHMMYGITMCLVEFVSGGSRIDNTETPVIYSEFLALQYVALTSSR